MFKQLCNLCLLLLLSSSAPLARVWEEATKDSEADTRHDMHGASRAVGLAGYRLSALPLLRGHESHDMT